MAHGVHHFFRRLSIRSKLLYGYALAFILAIVIGNALLYLMIRNTIETDIELELRNTTESILNMVETATDVAIKNHLRAVAEKNREIVDHFYQLQQNGKLSEKQAKGRAAEIILSQVIGTTGYIYCINSNGVIQVHPSSELDGVDLSNYLFIKQQKEQREGYLEYVWANPGEQVARPKALYMTYFKPWDWIIAASSYRSEFKELFDVDDFRESILSISFGETGYPYVIDSLGNLIIHPKLEGTNIYDSRDSSGRMFIKELCSQKNGKIIYPWQNPGEPEPREKLVIFNYIPEFDWIVASSSYLEEFYEPLRNIGYTSLGMVIFTLILIIPITWWLSTSITRPIQELTEGFAHGADGDYSSRLGVRGGAEIGQLAAYYNRFMEQLHTSRKNLEESEEKYRSIFEHAVEGVFQTSMDGRFLSANPAIARMLGYKNQESLLVGVKDLKSQVYVDSEDRETLLDLLKEHGTVTDFETRFRRTDDTVFWISLNARIVRDSAGDIKWIEGLISDITQRKESEEALRMAKQDLEQRVEERTTELSSWVQDLEIMNRQRSQLQDMGQMIQLCRSTEETYPIITQFLKSFFPDDVASLYIYNEELSALKPVGAENDTLSFEQEDCWALRQGKPYLVDANHDLPGCAHVKVASPHGYSCTPLIALGELIGLVHIIFGESASGQSEDRQRLASTIADNLALALANLKLRETLRLQSIQDPLTTLYNRRFMEETISKEVSRSVRRERAFGILMIDIDHFKKVNDTYGHDVGDAVLRELGAYLSSHVRSEDIPCRYGGEEFAVIMNEVSLENLRDKAQELCSDIADTLVVHTNGTDLKITISIGAALFPEHGESAQAVLKAADKALYEAKESGRNRVEMAG